MRQEVLIDSLDRNDVQNQRQKQGRPNQIKAAICNLTLNSDALLDTKSQLGRKTPPGHLTLFQKQVSSPVPRSSNNDMQFAEVDVSQTSFSFAVSPSQKPLLIQAVYTAMLVRHLVSSWEHKILHVNAQERAAAPEDQEQLQQRLMATCHSLEDT